MHLAAHPEKHGDSAPPFRMHLAIHSEEHNECTSFQRQAAGRERKALQLRHPQGPTPAMPREEATEAARTMGQLQKSAKTGEVKRTL